MAAAGDASLVVQAILNDRVSPALARLAASVNAAKRAMGADADTGVGSKKDSESRQRELFKIDDAMARTARRMGSRVILIGTAIAAAAGQAVAFTDALWPMIGALGAVPAVTVSLGVGLTTLIMGFKGLGAAMKATGGGASNSAQQIANAERRVEQAHRNLRDAQDALNDAQEEASDRVRDLGVAYQRSQLDQKEAALAVKDAEKALRDARTSGNRDAIKRAELALESARLSQVETTNAATDTAQEYAKAQESASKTVRDAQERQADATYELAEAQRALAEAGKGGGGADAMAKLSAAGQALVVTLQGLKDRWKQVQVATQQSMLAGVAGDVRALSDRYLPVMLRQLPAVAQGWNNMFRSIAATAGTKGFVADIDQSLGKMAVMWQRVGSAFGPFLHGFKDWVVIGSNFLPRLGSWILTMATRWSNWSADVRETGRGMRWIEKALVVGHKFNELIGAWGKNLFRVFQLGQDRTLLDRLIDSSREFGRWLETAEGAQRITTMWARLREVGSALWGVVKNLASILAQLDVSGVTIAFQTLGTILGAVASSMAILNPLFKVLIPLLVGFKVAAIAASIVGKAFGLTLKVITDAFSLLIIKADQFGFQSAMTARNGFFVLRSSAGATAAQLALANRQLTIAAAKTAAAGLAMAGLSVGVGALGVQMIRSGGIIEGLLMLGLAASGLVGNIRTAVIPAISSLIARFGALRVAVWTSLGVIGLVAGALMLFAGRSKGAAQETRDLSRDMDVLVKSGGKLTGQLKDVFDVLDRGIRDGSMDELIQSSRDFTKALQDLDDGLTQALESGTSYNDIVASIARSQGWTTKQAQDYLDQLPRFSKAVDDARERSEGLAGATDDSARSYEHAKEALQDYYDQQLAVANDTYNFLDTQQRLAEAQERYNKAVEKHGADSQEAIDASWELAQAQTAFNEALAKIQGTDLGPLKTQIQQMYETGRITAETYQNLLNTLNGLAGKYVPIYLNIYANKPKSKIPGVGTLEFSDIPGFAEGGPVPGAKGEPQLILAHGGEVVVNPDKPGQNAPMAALGVGGGPQALDVNLNVTGGASEFERFLVAWLRKIFRTQGASSFGLKPA